MRKTIAVLFVAGCAFASARAVTKSDYLDIMEAAVAAYSDERVASYVETVEREGVHEHGFPRFAANLGILVANGRLVGKKELLRQMMTISCRESARGPMKLEGHEFSVKELTLALAALEKAGTFEKSVTDAWRADLSRVEPYRCYRRKPEPGAERAFNWCVFGSASEQARIAFGVGGDAAFVAKYVADQMRWFDTKGMYRDPFQPAFYDLVTRLQFMAILDFGYDSPYRPWLEHILDISEEPTLAMLSAAGEIPYGGRSNQFLHNHTVYAAVCEWYAARAKACGDVAKASRFRRAAQVAVDALKAWLSVRPLRHVKNFYPTGNGTRGTGIGCERYAYFEKYMITMGSWAMLAHRFADESIPPSAGACDIAPLSFATTPDFHFVFLRAGDYSAQFDYNADTHYDCDGLGRVQRAGAPSTICLSTPCATAPQYLVETTNTESLAIMPVVPAGTVLVPAGHGHDASSAWADWTVGGLTWKCLLTAEGLETTLSGEGVVAMKLPAFAFDGERATEIRCDGKSLDVSYNGWTCSYLADGEIIDAGRTCCNRNGRYRLFEARGGKCLSVKVEIRKVRAE